MMIADSFEKVLKALSAYDADETILIKFLMPNDNSKNQIYLGGDFKLLQMIPMGDLVRTEGTSNKKKKTSQIIKAQLPFHWLHEETGKAAPAPNVTLILYPQYPEIRLSGMLQGCAHPPKNIFNNRDEGRILIMGVSSGEQKQIYAFALRPESECAKQLFLMRDSGQLVQVSGPLFSPPRKDPVLRLSERLASDIDFTAHYKTFRLDSEGNRIFSQAKNSPGTTLEGLLGIRPNSIPGPDLLEWELKAVSSKNQIPQTNARVTLLTAEPNSGIYTRDNQTMVERYCGVCEDGATYFTGPWQMGPKKAVKRGLVLEFPEMGNLYLKDIETQEIVCEWDSVLLLNHWKNKHAHAAIISYTKNADKEIQFSRFICIAEGADFLRFASAIRTGLIIYDPGVKYTIAKEGWKTHKRNQWRANLVNFPNIYEKFRIIDVACPKENIIGNLSARWQKALA